MNGDHWVPILSGEDRSLAASATRTALGAIEPGYRLIVAARNKMFDLNLRRPAKLARTTISVGNLTTGGTGKTPMVIELARQLFAMGQRPAVLLRGYGSSRTPGRISDEAEVLRNELGSAVPVEPNPSRVAGARAVLQRCPETSVFLLDDAFQHRQVHRDLDLVLVDARQPFGFDRVLPRGLLREPRGNLRRADGVIVTRTEEKLLATPWVRTMEQAIQKLTGRPPLAYATQEWVGYRDHEGRLHPLRSLRETAVVGVCGIGNPMSFAAWLEGATGRVVWRKSYPDHHVFRRRDELIEGILRKAVRDGAAACVTTEKDWVKWQPLLAGETPPIPIFRPMLRTVFLRGGEAVEALLRQTVEATQKVS